MPFNIKQNKGTALAAFGLTLASLVFAFGVRAQSGAEDTKSYEKTYDNYVRSDGTIVVPDNYRTEFVFLGSFGVAGGNDQGGQQEFHQVYIDRDSVAHYRETGQFPDGAMLVKELQGARSLDLTTGHVSIWNEGHGWFVMIKDTQGRYEGNGLWGDGWGWALYDKSDRTTPTTTDYKAECIACHTPVQKTDWIHVWAYPLLDAQGKFSTFNK